MKAQERQCRSPQGLRGLKFFPSIQQIMALSRSLQGLRGLKYFKHTRYPHLAECRSPQGLRGLKYMAALKNLSQIIVAVRKDCVD